MSEHIMENLIIRPLNDVSEKLSKRANEHEIRNGTLLALTERCNRLEAENAKLREELEDQEGYDQMLRDRLRQQTELCVKAEAENAKLWELVLGYAKIANYFCEREGYCSRDFVAQCRYYMTQQCRLGELNDKLHELRIEV